MVLKIVHTADWHLGHRFRSFDPDDEKKLAQARLKAVERILYLAEQYNVDAVLCAGDLFDEPEPSADAVVNLVKAFQRRQWTRPVFLLPGNHDPLTSHSVYREGGQLRRDLPDYVTVVDREDFEAPIGPDAVLYAVPCRSQSGQDDPAKYLPIRQEGDDRIWIGMAHGQTSSFDGGERTFPIDPETAKKHGFDYLAMGDIHSYQKVTEDPPVVYPSAPEPLTFGETEAGFASLVLFPRRPRKPTVRKQPIAHWHWRQEVIHSVEAVRELISEPDLDRTVLKLVLDLKATVPELEELDALIAEMKGSLAAHGRVGVLRVEEQRREVDTSGIEREAAIESLPEVLQTVVARLKQLEAEEPEMAARAVQHLYRLVKELS